MMRPLPTAAAATTGILVGAAIVASRFALDQTGPATLALLRYAVGCCCLWPLAAAGLRLRFERRDLPAVCLLGVLQFAVVVGLLNVALQTVPSARAALIFSTSPLQTLIIAALVGHERLNATKTAGVVLTIVGVGLALGEEALRGGGPAVGWFGELLVLGSAFSNAVCSVLYRPYLRKYDPLPVGAVAMLASVVALLPLAWGEGFFAAPPGFNLEGWLAVLFIGVSSGIGYFLWLWALSRTAASNVAVFLALNPITATGLGALLLGERVSSAFLLGLIALTSGLWLALRNGKAGRPSPKEAIP